jgi:Uma2 family endonuclease
MGMALSLPKWTISDLAGFPVDGNRYELLEGALLVTPQPSPPHQVLATRLTVALEHHLRPSGAALVVAPGELERAPGTHLEPDLLVYPARFGMPERWTGITEWWLAVEILSPSSRIYDREYKREAYLQLGVREVWLVDPRDRRVLVSDSRRRDAPHATSLAWQPPAPLPALKLDLQALFVDVPGQWQEDR